MKIGCVLNDGGHIIALSRNDAVKAAARMKDTTKNNKAFEKNIYIKGYTQSEQDRLALLWDDFFAMKQEKQEQQQEQRFDLKSIVLNDFYVALSIACDCLTESISLNELLVHFFSSSSNNDEKSCVEKNSDLKQSRFLYDNEEFNNDNDIYVVLCVYVIYLCQIILLLFILLFVHMHS